MEDAAVIEAGWFMTLLTLGILAFEAGRRVRHRGRLPAVLLAVISTTVLAAWLWLLHHPALALRVMPSSILACLEGTAALPPAMLLLGVAWADSRRLRHRALTSAAVVVCAAYFVYGGIWMIQPTATHALSNRISPEPVAQSEKYSCVPAACATALNQLGVQSTEAQMAQLTRTHRVTGATLIRAVDGLNRRLAHTTMRAEMIDRKSEPLSAAAMPALTALRFERNQTHLITVLRVHRFGVDIFDPVDGAMFMPMEAFERYAVGTAIVFRDALEPAGPRVALATRSNALP